MENINALITALQTRLDTVEQANQELITNNNRIVELNNILQQDYRQLQTSHQLLQTTVQLISQRMPTRETLLIKEINKAVRSVQCCDGNNITAFLTELRNVFAEYEGGAERDRALEFIIRAAKGRIQNADPFKHIETETLDDFEDKLRAEFFKGVTLKDCEAQLMSFAMEKSEKIESYVKRTKTLRENLRHAVKEYNKANNIPHTPEVIGAKEKELTEAFRKGLPHFIKVDARGTYATLDEAIMHAREIYNSTRHRHQPSSSPSDHRSDDKHRSSKGKNSPKKSGSQHDSHKRDNHSRQDRHKKDDHRSKGKHSSDTGKNCDR